MQRLTTLFLTLRAWPSFPLFFALREATDVPAAAGAALSLSLYFLLFALGRNQATHLDFGVALYWLAGLAGALAGPSFSAAWLGRHGSAALAGSLFLAAFLPLVFGAEPFTAVFARRRTAPDLWQTPQFLAINRIMALVWAAILLTGCLLALLLPGWPGTVAPLALSAGLGLPFTRRFPGWYLRRNAGSAPGAGPAPDAALPGVASASAPAASTDAERQRVAGRLGPVKNALIIQGSPRGASGATAKVLARFCEGMEAGGIRVETVILKDHTIRPCTGCFSCWTKTPGVCIHKDDMAGLLARVAVADLVVYAQPLYVFSVPGIVKNFLDRSLPRLLPYLIAGNDGVTRHPRRDGREEGGRMLVFSVCGFPERRHFDPLLAMFRHLSLSGNTPIVGEIVRPAAESLRFGGKMGSSYDWLFDALFAAGRQVAEQGYVHAATEDAIAAPLLPTMAGFQQVANRFWDTCIRYEEEKRAGRTSLDREAYAAADPGIYFAGMAAMFDPDRAGDLAGTLQFQLTGEEKGSFVLEIGEGQCRFREGAAAMPDLTVETSLATWQAIGRGELSGEAAYQQGLYRARGNLGLLARLRAALAQ